MNHPSSYYRRVLAVDPYDQGLGFALFGGPEELMDWGLKEAIGGKSIGMRKALNKLIERSAATHLRVRRAPRTENSNLFARAGERSLRVIPSSQQTPDRLAHCGLVSGIGAASSGAANGLDEREPVHERVRRGLVRLDLLPL